MLRIVCSLWLAVLSAEMMFAQSGDKQGEVQRPRVPAEKIPPSPPLSPDEALKAFKIAPGFKIQTVAHEPDVEVPIALQFDPDGRLWVLEMRSFMPNADGQGEDKPSGRISILEDGDGDGVAEKAKVLLDGLVMPRAFLLAQGGVLVAEPPSLWFYPVKDDKPGPRVLVDEEYAKEADTKLGTKANPEHAANSLTLAMDNWIYSLYHTKRYRFMEGKWVSQPTTKRAQYGLSQDNYGRLFYNSNSDQARADLVPAHYVLKAGLTAKLPGLGVQLSRDQSVWPIRVNPGVNRGYQTGTLRPDGTLAKFTAACGTGIFRGDALPDDCIGNAFFGEPSGNIVRRNLLSEENGTIVARNAYDKAEFLASTDELFRPVNCYTGPDGALYIVDMYHGIIQHRFFLTSYLRQQAESRNIDKVTRYGRIYRVTHETKTPSPRPRMSAATTGELIGELAHANGWRRDTAQRLLVERQDPAAAAPLQKAATGHTNHLARLHALWTLEGLAKIDSGLLRTAFGDPHPKVRAAALRLSEPLLLKDSEASLELRQQVLGLAGDPAADVQVQLALTLGELTPNEAINTALTNLLQSKVALARDAAKFSLTARQVKVATNTRPKAPRLSPEEQKRFDIGKSNYETVCLPCHQPHGLGQEGLAPPLAGTEWVSGPEGRLVRIVLHGLRGPITVKGQPFELDMPALGILDDEQIATILTYIRNEWGHSFAPVSTEAVKKIRAETASREEAWTQEELFKIQ